RSLVIQFSESYDKLGGNHSVEEVGMHRGFGLLAWLLWLTLPVQAHVSMLLPSSPSAKKGEEVTFTYQWGHPFEHQLFDTPRPDRVVVLAPGGKPIDLGASLQKAERSGAEGKPVAVWQFRFTPRERGDYIFVLTSTPILLREEDYVVQDTVKVVLHVQA